MPINYLILKKVPKSDFYLVGAALGYENACGFAQYLRVDNPICETRIIKIGTEKIAYEKELHQKDGD